MSVPVYRRKEQKLAALEVAENLCAYTIQQCSEEKHFPKRYRWCLTSKVVDCAVNFLLYLNRANGIRAENKREMAIRLEFLTRAIAEINALFSLVSMCAKVGEKDADQGKKVRLSNLEHWLAMCDKARALAMGVRNADAKTMLELPD